MNSTRIDEWIEVFRNTKPAKGTSGVFDTGRSGTPGKEAIRKEKRCSIAACGYCRPEDISSIRGYQCREPFY